LKGTRKEIKCNVLEAEKNINMGVTNIDTSEMQEVECHLMVKVTNFEASKLLPLKTNHYDVLSKRYKSVGPTSGNLMTLGKVTSSFQGLSEIAY
jgi:hypothetical protein